MTPTPSPGPPAPDGILQRALFGGRLAWLKKLAQWFNLTMLQQALWPLLLLMTSAPAVNVDQTPTAWFVARVAGPILAALLALFFIRRASTVTGPEPVEASHSTLQQQARYFVIGVAIALTIARFVAGPIDEVTRTIFFGLAMVAAYQLIHFGVVPLSFNDTPRPWMMPVFLFGVSWGVHDGLLVSSEDGTWYLAILAGCVLGWIVGAGSAALRKWPGGGLTAAAAHFSIVYLIFGFL